jgi:hypothetical protein
MAGQTAWELANTEQQLAEKELAEHKPIADVYGEKICVACAAAAPCDRALRLMKTIQRARDVRIRINARGALQ